MQRTQCLIRYVSSSYLQKIIYQQNSHEKTLVALQQLHSPLTQVHTILSERSAYSFETEALLGALGEEIEDILDDLSKGKTAAEAYEGIQVSLAEQRGQALEQELVKLLKTSEGLAINLFVTRILMC